MINALWMIIGTLVLTIFLFKFSPTFEQWLRDFPVSNGQGTGNLMPGILVWFFTCFIIADFIIFIILIFNK